MNPALDGLKDIHLPPAPSWWPPAPAWWLLALLTIAVLAVGCRWLRRLLRQRRYRRDAMQALQQLARQQPPSDMPARVNAVLKRTALAAYPGEQTAHLNGPEWVQFLTSRADLSAEHTTALTSLAEGPYRPAARSGANGLVAAAQAWVRRHR